MSWFLPLDDQGGANHVVTCRDVKEEGFSPFRSDEDWGRRQGRFEAFESLLGFLGLDEGVRPFEELVEWHPLFTEPGDEAAQGSQTADEPLYALDIVYGAHVGDGRDLFRVGLDATLGHDVSKQLPLRSPENTFF